MPIAKMVMLDLAKQYQAIEDDQVVDRDVESKLAALAQWRMSDLEEVAVRCESDGRVNLDVWLDGMLLLPRRKPHGAPSVVQSVDQAASEPDSRLCSPQAILEIAMRYHYLRSSVRGRAYVQWVRSAQVSRLRCCPRQCVERAAREVRNSAGRTTIGKWAA